MPGGIIGAGVHGGASAQFPEEVILDNLEALKPGTIKLFNEGLTLAPVIREAFPDALIFGRLWLGPSDNEANALCLSNPTRYAPILAEQCLTHPANTEVNGWQSLNEPPTDTAVDCQRIVDFDCIFADALAQGDRWSCGSSIGGGGPVYMGDIIRWKPYLERPNAIFTYDGYSQRLEHPDDSWTVYRYQKMRLIVNMPRIWFGETGHELGGYKALGISEEAYIADFKNRALHWRLDGIIGAATFLCRGNNGWPNFDIINTSIPAGLGEDNRAHPWTPPIAAYPSQQGGGTMEFRDRWPQEYLIWKQGGGISDVDFLAWMAATRAVRLRAEEFEMIANAIKGNVEALKQLAMAPNP